MKNMKHYNYLAFRNKINFEIFLIEKADLGSTGSTGY